MTLKTPLEPDDAFVLLLRIPILVEAFKPELLGNDRVAMVAIVTRLLTNPEAAWEDYAPRFMAAGGLQVYRATVSGLTRIAIKDGFGS